jgi:hypothetical protein
MRETLLYGLKEGELLHISQVENGIKCKCKCPACGEELKAVNLTKQIKKNGELRLRSFAHLDPKKKCTYATETALHYLAKQVLLKQNKIKLPAITSFIQYGITKNVNGKFISNADCIEFKKADYYYYQKVELEKYLHDIKPDVILTIDRHKLYIEIKVTHGIDEIKFDKIKSLNISIIQIDLKGFDPLTIDETLLTNHLIHSIETKKWYNNSKQKLIDEQIKQAEQSYTQNHFKDIVVRQFQKPEEWGYETLYYNHIDNCKLKKREFKNNFYASVESDCIKCEHFKGYRQDKKKGVCLAE